MNDKCKTFCRHGSKSLAFASGLLIVLLAGLLVFNQSRQKVSGFVKSEQLMQLVNDLRHRPKDEQLKDRIRQLDLQLRQDLFHRLQVADIAKRTLLWALVVFLASVHTARSFATQMPDPLRWGARRPDDDKRVARFGGYAVLGVFLIAVGAAFAVAMHPVQLPDRQAFAQSAPDFPTAEEFARNWPRFRGPTGSGVSPSAIVPPTWNAKTNAGIRWKTAVPLAAKSSPVLWAKSLFLTGATATENRVFKFDADNGNLLWSVAVTIRTGVKVPAPKVNDETGFSASSPVTDGRRVYAIFANGEIAAIDFNGKQVWARNLGPINNAYGYATSLAIYQDRLLVQLDQGFNAEDGQSRLLALDTRTGLERWQISRPVSGSWATPIVVEINQRPQLITCANPLVISYNPLDGAELWRAKCATGDVAPSPILAGNLIVAISPNSEIVAVRADGKSDATATNVVWRTNEGVPDATSPISDGQRLYTLGSEGVLTCFELATGKVLWTHEFEEHFHASPAIAGNALILLGRSGTSYILETGDKYKELGKGDLGEYVGASPALAGNRMYVRGKEHLFCIEGASK